MAQPSVQLNFRVPVPVNAALERYCKVHGCSKTAAVVAAITLLVEDCLPMPADDDES
jgi:hypothetical protein